MRTAKEVQADQQTILNRLAESDIKRIEIEIANHVSKGRSQNFIDIELNDKVFHITKEKLSSLGYKVSQALDDPREPRQVTFTRVSWGI